jgi:hypothetical protein
MSCTLGIFIIRVPLFDHKTQGLCLYYLPNIKYKWNKFKWEILHNSNYDKFHGGGDFSHAYVIMHEYFGKKKKHKKCLHNFIYNLTRFLHENFLHILLILGVTNFKLSEYKKSTKLKKKKSFSLLPFQNGFCIFQNSYIVYYLIKCIIWTFPNNIYVCITYPWKKIELN